MRQLFPQFQFRVMRGNSLEWRGTLQPTLESPLYHTRIVHEHATSPRVYVDRPTLHGSAPHMYRGESLCLYWPLEWAWRPECSLADTIVPWAALWLYYYELWIVTGEWLGPSSPHQPSLARSTT